MFVDASAIVAILTREADADKLVERLESAASPITSAIAVFEAVLGINRKRQSGIDQTTRDVTDFLSAANIALVPIAPEHAGAALDAFSRYGKGQSHPAQLNLGDCFAYAMAKSRRTSLLFKGDDFAKTDLA